MRRVGRCGRPDGGDHMTEPVEYPHVGVGWVFPPRWVEPEARLAADGGLESSQDQARVQQSMELILATLRGSRTMRPTFGTGVDEYVFASRTAETCRRLEFEVGRSLLLHEPRVIVERVEARPSPGEHGRLDIEIIYRIDQHHRPTSMLLPFYLEEQQS